MKHDRRGFIGVLGGTLSAAILRAQSRSSDMPYRTLGKTGERVSVIGFGGAHIGRLTDQDEAVRLMRTAIDSGVNFMDNCWSYSGGKSETWMGDALRDGYRQKVFLMTKFDGRTKASTASHIDTSLKRLQTDVIDLMQFHENIRMEDPDRFFAPNGPLEALMEAKKAGKIRYIGFTGHKDPVVHLRMLEMAAKNNFHFDAAQMPINVLDASFRSFLRDVAPKLRDQGIALLGMKPMAARAIPQNNIASATDCLRFALSQPTSVVITGMESKERLDQALNTVRGFRPMPEAEISALVNKTREAALTGKFELFKTSIRFDGTALNPEWMG